MPVITAPRSLHHLFHADVHREVDMFTKNRLTLHEAHGTGMVLDASSVFRVNFPGHDPPESSSHTVFPETHSNPRAGR